MSDVEISEVTSRRERNAFIRFPWKIYASDPAWVPPLIIDRKAFLDRKRHPFYRHGDAALFLARKNGELVGRIMVSDDPNYNALHQSNVGCFGLFECINDRDVAAGLFERAASWLRKKARTEIMGPIDYSTNYTCGLLVHGFEHPPTLLTTHNPPYYEDLIAGWGFSKVIDFFAWWFRDPSAATARLRKLAARLESRAGFTLRRGNLRNLEAEASNFLRIYNEAWKDNWGFVPFTKEEFEHMAAEMKPLLRDDFTAAAEANGEAVGFALALPDINVALKKINGRLTTFGIPVGLIKLLYYKSRIRSARYIAMGVLPQFRRLGVAEMMVLRLMEAGMVKEGFQAELSMTLENNVLINRFIESIGAERYKIYRIYSKPIALQDPDLSGSR